MPNRLIVRLSADYLVRWAQFASSYNGGDLLMALVQSTVFQVSTEPLDRSARGGREPSRFLPEGARGISAYALASALGQPRETVRRKVKHLLAQGYVVEGPDGIRIPDGHLDTARSTQALSELAVMTEDFLTSLARLGVTAPVIGGTTDRSEAAFQLARATNRFCLRVLEDMARSAGGDMIGPLVFSAISVANTRHLALEPDSAIARWESPIQDDLRRPITALALAQVMGLPRETLRRYLAKVVSAGGCRRVRGGYIAVETAFQSRDAKDLAERIVIHARHLVAAMPASIFRALEA